MSYPKNIILIDTPSKEGWSHMICQDLDTLHKFAVSLELKRHWFQNKRGKNQPHYDVRKIKFDLALKMGAIKVTGKELFMFLKENFS